MDTVAAVFPFGSEEFVGLREGFWLQTITAAARAERSLVFTFAPEPTVSADFPARLSSAVEEAGGDVVHIALTLDEIEQERRLMNSDRATYGKLRSIELLRSLRPGMAACMAAMPAPAVRIDTGVMTAVDAANLIIDAISA